MLAAKSSLACRVDALGESSEVTIGIDARQVVEDRLRSLDNTVVFAVSGGGKKKGLGKHEAGRVSGNTALVGAGTAGYNAASDSTTPKPVKRKADSDGDGAAAAAAVGESAKKTKTEKKEKKEKREQKEKKEKKEKKDKKSKD